MLIKCMSSGFFFLLPRFFEFRKRAEKSKKLVGVSSHG